MTQYRTAIVSELGQLSPLSEPFPTYMDAVLTAARTLQRDYVRSRIFLDLGSVNLFDEHDVRELLIDDPLLRTIYELGRADQKHIEPARPLPVDPPKPPHHRPYA